MKTLDFNSEGLKIDFLSLNLQFYNPDRIKQIANFLGDTLHCKSTLFDQSSKKWYLLTKTNKNIYSAEFVVNSNKYWRGVILRFKGNHAQLFYKDLKFQKFANGVFNLSPISGISLAETLPAT